MMIDWRRSMREAMARHRWTIAALCKRTGIKRQTMQNWLAPKGGRGQPDIEDCILLAQAMRISLDELFRGRVPDDEIDAILARAGDALREAMLAGSRPPARETGESARIHRE